MRVEVWHNKSDCYRGPDPDYRKYGGMFVGYVPGNKMAWVWTGEIDGTMDPRVLEAAFELHNIGDPEGSGGYRPYRSLSVGDVVVVDGRAYSCDDIGWTRLWDWDPKAKYDLKDLDPLWVGAR